jgi:hypothetical protein
MIRLPSYQQQKTPSLLHHAARTPDCGNSTWTMESKAKANAIFDLPNTRQSLLYHHALAGFPRKETFLAVVHAGNYAMWPSLTTTLILKHFPNMDKMQKGHMKGQWKGVRLTKELAPVTIKVEPGAANPPPPTIKSTTTSLLWCTNCWTPSTQTKQEYSQSCHNAAIGK